MVEKSMVVPDGSVQSEVEALHDFIGKTRDWDGDNNGICLYVYATAGDTLVLMDDGVRVIKKQT